MKVLVLAFLLIFSSCASKQKIIKEDTDPYFILKEATLECVSSQYQGQNLKPYSVMAEHPRCVLLLRVYDQDNILFLDCTEEQLVGFTLIYTQNLNACNKIKALFIKNLTTPEI